MTNRTQNACLTILVALAGFAIAVIARFAWTLTQ